MPLDAATPVYPGDPAPRIVAEAGFGDAGYLTHRLELGSHSGTHIDAEAHLVPGGRGLADYPVERFTGVGKVVDLRPGAPVAPLEQLERLRVGTGDAVLLRSGLSDHHTDPDYARAVPAIDAALAEELARRHPNLVAVDALSVDAAPYPVHTTLLAAGVLIVENLLGIAQLAPEPFRLWALPLRLATEAAPARVLAQVGG